MTVIIKPEYKILIIAPHPEDIVIACGGFVSKYSSQTDLLCIIPYENNSVLTHIPVNLLQEIFDNIAQRINFNKVYIGKNPETEDANRYYEDYLSEINIGDYDIILAPNKDERRADQKFAGNTFLKNILGKQTYKPTLQILRYELMNPLKTADYYEDITDVIDKKKNLISIYRNDNNYIEQMINLSKFRAFTSCYNQPGKYVEAYCEDDVNDILQIPDIINELTDKNYSNEQMAQLFMEENIQEKIDEFAHKHEGQKIILFGAGDYTRYVFKNYDISKLNIIAISDKRFEQDRQHEFYNLNCITPKALKDAEFDIIAVSEREFIPSYNFLTNMFEGGKNSAKDIFPLLKKELKNCDKDFVCARPFHTMSILPSGHCITCCPAYINNYTIGNSLQQSIKDIWNGKKAATLRNLLIDNDYSICDLNTCIQMELVQKKELSAYFDKDTGIVKMPDTIYMGWDYDCNVACITCRSKLIKNNQNELAHLKTIEPRVLEACKNAKLFYTSGNGDPFGSAYSRDLIKKVVEINPDIKFFIHTNGVLCTEKLAEELNIKDKIEKVIFSIHSSRKETYDKIVKYGNYEKVMKNAEWISRLKQQGQIKTFIMAFVVHKLNYRDMPDFVRIAEKYDALASFRYYRQWANNTEYTYEDMAVFEKWHPEYPQLVSVLQDDIFNSSHCSLDPTLRAIRLNKI